MDGLFIKTSKLAVCLLLFCMTSSCLAQTSNGNQDTVIAAGTEYEASSFHNFFFGSHWRDVWTTPVHVPILDLNTFAGGLTPTKKGGGFQTKSLRFKGGDQHYWKFRSIAKDPSKTLAEDLRESIADDILQDQISSSHPYAAFVVAPILDTLNILQAKPSLYYLPDVPELGEFQEEFGGMYGIIEIHPDVEEEDDIVFEGADNVKGTLKLFVRLEEKTTERVNSEEYLKARLVDIFLGDWDRHADQWKWARFKEGDQKLWYPIPRDRDQAFAKFDGLLVRLAEYLLMQFNSFEKTYNNIEKLTWNGRFVDRHFLIQLSKEQWDSITTYVQTSLTDHLIASAVLKLPPEIYLISAEELETKLKSRRDKLHEISEEYYNFINTVVDVYASQKDDYVEIERINDNETRLLLIKNIKKGNGKNHPPYFQKIFDNRITDEIRIYLDKGDDKALLRGVVNDGILIRIIGGKGKDSIVDSSKVNGHFLSITPFETAENKTRIYDSGKKTKIVYGPGTSYDNTKVIVPDDLEELYRPLQRDRSSESFFYPIINYTSDNGFIFGGAGIFTSFGFRAVPYGSRYSISAQYATLPSNGAIHFSSTHNSLIKGASVNFDINLDGLLFTTYYGYGNETELSEELEKDNFYRLEQRLVSIMPSIDFPFSEKTKILFGVSYLYSDSELMNRSLLDVFPRGEYGLGKFSTFRTHLNLSYDSRDRELFADKGIYALGSVYYFPKALDNRDHFGGAFLDMNTYFTTYFITKTTFNFNAYGRRVWGNFPFLTSAFLGGQENLLGYRRERFSGYASVYGRALLRIQLAQIKLIINGKIGMHGFAETGRVFTETENSKIWHPGYGGGVWLSYLDHAFNLVLTFAQSEESFRFYFTTDFAF